MMYPKPTSHDKLGRFIEKSQFIHGIEILKTRFQIGL